MLQMPICAFCRQRFVDVGDEADDDVPLCPACVEKVVPGPSLTGHPLVRAYRDMTDEDLYENLLREMSTHVVNLLRNSPGYIEGLYGKRARERLADIRFYEDAILNYAAEGVYWNTGSPQRKNCQAHTFPCKHFGKGRGAFSRERIGYECGDCGDHLAFLKSRHR